LLNSKVILKYTLVHLAELGLLVVALIAARQVIGISTWLVITILALWVIKDVVLFRKVWRAYAWADNAPMQKLIGMEATVLDGLDPVGYVRVRGELWKAEVIDPRYPAERGEKTRVVDVKGMLLIVESRSDRQAGRSIDGVSP